MDKYNTQQAIALLKLLINNQIMYDRTGDINKGERLQKKTYHDLLYISAMSPTNGSRTNIDARFLSLFNIMLINYPEYQQLHYIYNQIISKHLEYFHLNINDDLTSTINIDNLSAIITTATINLYQLIVNKLPATPKKFDYIFNLRDLSKIYQGLLLATPKYFNNIISIIRLWRHEIKCIFYDRLNNQKDRNLLDNQLIPQVINQMFNNNLIYVDQILKDPLIFTDINLNINDVVISSVSVAKEEEKKVQKKKKKKVTLLV